MSLIIISVARPTATTRYATTVTVLSPQYNLNWFITAHELKYYKVIYMHGEQRVDLGGNG